MPVRQAGQRQSGRPPYWFLIFLALVSTPLPAAGAPAPITHGARADSTVALTFDFCPARGYDTRIVEYLRRERIPATFFMTASWIEARGRKEAPNLLADPALFEFACHGRRHLDCRRLTDTGLRDEIDRAESILTTWLNEHGAAAMQTAFFRFPFGYYDARSLAAVERAGLIPVQWEAEGDVDSGISPRALARRILKQVEPGSIILLHVNIRCQATAQALPLIVEGLRRRGLRPVRLREMSGQQ